MHTIETLRKDAGEDLCALIERVFSADQAIDWFYQRNIPELGGTPAQIQEQYGSDAVIKYFTRRIASFAQTYDQVEW